MRKDLEERREKKRKEKPRVHKRDQRKRGPIDPKKKD